MSQLSEVSELSAAQQEVFEVFSQIRVASHCEDMEYDDGFPDWRIIESQRALEEHPDYRPAQGEEHWFVYAWTTEWVEYHLARRR